MKARKLGALLLSAMLTVTGFAGCSAAGQTTSGAEAQATAENGYGLEEFVMVMIPGEDTEKSIQLRDTMAEEMSQAIGIPVTTYRATDYSAAVEAMRTGNAQLAYLGPFSYVTARERAGAECLVVQGQVGTKGGYKSYIVVRADSGIQSLEDHPFQQEDLSGRRCRLCGAENVYFDEIYDAETGQRYYQCSDTGYCLKRRNAQQSQEEGETTHE